ncbi:MAG TPA: hypothetical protein VFJ43_02735 [Bacteroidia bacterium]|nr:hypothetical protein [Bacteroidia bacterium]
MAKRRKILVIILILLLGVGVVCLWLMRRNKMMSADITSSNGARYAMLLPNDFTPAHLNDSAASLQYESIRRGMYVLVIDESKAKIISFGLDYDLETYMKIATRAKDVEGVHINRPVTINGNKGFQTDIIEMAKGKKMFYRLTCIETPKFFYQVLIASPESTMEANKADMDKMVSSFKEVEK